MRTEPHEPTVDCADEHCFTHNVDEPSDGAYRVCFECGHVFPTQADLVKEYEAMATDLEDPIWSEAFGLPQITNIPIPKAENIFYCTFCSADFM